MTCRLTFAACAAVVLSAGGAQAQPAATAQGHPGGHDAAAHNAAEAKLMTIAEAKQRYRGPLSRVVLEFLSRMETAVNKDKQTASAADWEPVGALIDRERFHRVGNFAEHMGWQEYTGLLVGWAKSSWWKGYIWRISEVPAGRGKPGLVYLEAEERSSQQGPVADQGPFSKLESISVYEIDRNNKIVGLHVYDHRPR